MKLSSLMLGGGLAIAVIAGVLWVLGFGFHPPITEQGAALYNANNEMTATGVVQELQEFDCPVSEHELGAHLKLQTADAGTLQIHMAPSRILRGQNIKFAVGDKLTVVGAKFRFEGKNGIIAREITRGDETIIFRNNQGKLLLVQ